MYSKLINMTFVSGAMVDKMFEIRNYLHLEKKLHSDLTLRICEFYYSFELSLHYKINIRDIKTVTLFLQSFFYCII